MKCPYVKVLTASDLEPETIAAGFFRSALSPACRGCFVGVLENRMTEVISAPANGFSVTAAG